MKTKRMLSVICAALVLASLCSCSREEPAVNDVSGTVQVEQNVDATKDEQNAQTTAPEVEKKASKVERNLDSVAEALGLEGGKSTLFAFIGAIDGKEYNDGNVELYQFDVDADAYAQIIGDDSPLSISAYKDGFVLLFPAGVAEDADLVARFNDIVFAD